MKHYRIPAVIRINQCSSANRPTDRYMCTMQSTVVPSTQQMTATAMMQPTMIAMISTTVRPLAADDRYTSVTHTHTLVASSGTWNPRRNSVCGPHPGDSPHSPSHPRYSNPNSFLPLPFLIHPFNQSKEE